MGLVATSYVSVSSNGKQKPIATIRKKLAYSSDKEKFVSCNTSIIH